MTSDPMAQHPHPLEQELAFALEPAIAHPAIRHTASGGGPALAGEPVEQGFVRQDDDGAKCYTSEEHARQDRLIGVEA
jgi:hypothetical protein